MTEFEFIKEMARHCPQDYIGANREAEDDPILQWLDVPPSTDQQLREQWARDYAWKHYADVMQGFRDASANKQKARNACFAIADDGPLPKIKNLDSCGQSPEAQRATEQINRKMEVLERFLPEYMIDA